MTSFASWFALLLFLPGIDEPETTPVPQEAVAIVECDWTDEDLASILDELRGSLSKECGIEVPRDVTAKFVSRDELTEALVEEIEAQFLAIAKAEAEDGRQGVSEFQARADGRLAATGMAIGCLAKYRFATKEILICAENIESLQRDAALPSSLASKDGVRAIMIHECIHASDHAVHAIDDRIAAARSHDELRAFGSVVEGHAQFATRRAVEKIGGKREFEEFTAWIGGPPDTEPKVDELLLRVVRAAMASSYYDGERFITAIFQHGGADAIARAFAAPPKESILIECPHWYLDPTTRPRSSIDLDAAIEAVVSHHEEDKFEERRLTPGIAELRAAGSTHPDQEFVARVFSKLLGNRFVMLSPHHGIEDGIWFCGAFDFQSADDAIAFVTLESELSAQKDELMKEGPIRIVSSATSEVAFGDERATYIRKTMDADGTEAPVVILLARRGKVMVEVMVSGADLEGPELAAIAGKMLDAAFGEATK